LTDTGGVVPCATVPVSVPVKAASVPAAGLTDNPALGRLASGVGVPSGPLGATGPAAGVVLGNTVGGAIGDSVGVGGAGGFNTDTGGNVGASGALIGPAFGFCAGG
jgi:hypothetical protein